MIALIDEELLLLFVDFCDEELPQAVIVKPINTVAQTKPNFFIHNPSNSFYCRSGFGRNSINNPHGQLILNAIIKETNVRGVKMSEKNPFEIVDGQVILHNEFQGIDEVILNYEQVAAIKLLIQKCSGKGHDQSQSN